MTETPQQAESAGTATAVAEPPNPPAPPSTATGESPRPKRRRWVAWVVGIVIALIAIGALVGVVVWATGRNASTSDFSAYRAGYESAMDKAGTKAAFPDAPVELDGVTATGSHPFEATFSADEITALVNVFAWNSEIQGTSVAVSGVRVGFPSAGIATLRTRAKVNGSSYSGSIEAPATYANGQIDSSGATKAVAEGFPVPADQAKQATALLLVYLNAYLDAAPGLVVETAEITSSGLAVSGTAPDALTLP